MPYNYFIAKISEGRLDQLIVKNANALMRVYVSNLI